VSFTGDTLWNIPQPSSTDRTLSASRTEKLVKQVVSVMATRRTEHARRRTGRRITALRNPEPRTDLVIHPIAIDQWTEEPSP
jgi:hypothetical protein